MFRRIALVLVALLALAAPAAAQPDQWGISVSVMPSWQSGPGDNRLFGADRIDLQGSDFRIGFVRGIDLSGDWGLSFVKTTIAQDSSLDVHMAPCQRGSCGTFLRTIEPTRMTGLEFHQFQPFTTWKDRVQLGLVGAVGVGWMHGQVYKRTTSDSGDTESFTADAAELFPPSKSVVPIFRLEIAAAAIVVRGVKVRASGGFGMPGYHTFGVTFTYLIPQ